MINEEDKEITHVYKFMKVSDDTCSSCNKKQVDYYQRFVDLVINKELYFAKPSSFNDPFDSWVKFEDKIKIKDFEDYLKRKHLTRLPDGANNSAEGIVIMNNHFKKISKSISDDVLGVTCFSRMWDSLLLWAHYADSHRGICVGFKTQFLHDSVCIETNDFPSIDAFGIPPNGIMPLVHVKYSHGMPKPYNPYTEIIEDLRQFLLTKSMQWSYEEEFRAILTKPEAYARKISLCDSTIDEIILGAKMKAEDRRKVLDLLKSINKTYQVYEAYFDENSYSINRKPIYP